MYSTGIPNVLPSSDVEYRAATFFFSPKIKAWEKNKKTFCDEDKYEKYLKLNTEKTPLGFNLFFPYAIPIGPVQPKKISALFECQLALQCPPKNGEERKNKTENVHVKVEA